MTAPSRFSGPIVFKNWFGIRATAADLLDVLYRAPRACGTAWLAAAARQTERGVMLNLAVLRGAMDAGSIEDTEPGVYQLTAVGRADCAAAFADAEKRA